MNKRKTILVFVDWFVPGTNAGGPIRSVFSLVKWLKQEFDFKIFTRNTDHNSTTPYENIQANQWVKFDEGIEVFYCSEDNLDRTMIEKVLDNVVYDKVYLNSFYSKWFSVVPLQLMKKRKAAHKIVLAPRGMLGKGALQIKPLKKKAFILYSKLTGLHKGITWQASSENEQKDIVKVFGRHALIKVAGNLSYIDQLPFQPREKKPATLRMFFLSRIVPIKNLHVALMALKDLRDIEIVYDIYGPLEDAQYHRQCQEIIETLPANVKAVFKGVTENEQIQSLLQQYHVLYMPTLNENFGHSILESFCAGCPVIISDQTPWNKLEEQGVGYNVAVYEPGTQVALQKAIYSLAAMDENTFNASSRKAWDYGLRYQSGNKQVQASVNLFQ